jgi:hypothetical protein
MILRRHWSARRIHCSRVAKDEKVEVDAIGAEDLPKLFESFPGLGARFYRSLALVLARCLRETSKRFARKKGSRKGGSTGGGTIPVCFFRHRSSPGVLRP